MKVYLDGKRVKSTKLTRFSLRIKVRGLKVGATGSRWSRATARATGR